MIGESDPENSGGDPDIRRFIDARKAARAKKRAKESGAAEGEAAAEPEEPGTELEKLAKKVEQALTWLPADVDGGQSRHRGDPAERTQYFFVVAQYRVLMQLEQVVGLAEKSALINSLLQDSMNPQKLQQLVELLAQAHPVTQQLALRIFQVLLRMELPQELFEEAVAAAARVDPRGLPTRLATLLAYEGVLSFPESSFLQLLANSVQVVIEKQNTRGNDVKNQLVSTAHEAGRTLRVLQELPGKNQELARVFKERLSAALLRLDQLTEAEAETVCFLTSEMRVMSQTIDGQPLRYGTDEYYIKLSAHKRHYLYCDREKPERQQVVNGEPGGADQNGWDARKTLKFTPVADVDPQVTETAARNSVLMNPDVVRHLLTLAAGSEEAGIGALSKLTMRSVVCSINRGLKHMIETLKAEYVGFLASNSLLDPLMNYFIMVSGQSAIPFDERLRSREHKELQVHMQGRHLQRPEHRDHDYNKENLSTSITVLDDKSAVIIENLAYKFDCAKNKVTAVAQFEYIKLVACATKHERGVPGTLRTLGSWNTAGLTCFDWRRLECASRAGPAVYAIRSADIQALSFATIMLISNAAMVITDDEIGLQELLQNFVDAFKAQKLRAL